MGTPMNSSIDKPGKAARRSLVRRAAVAVLVACALLLWALMVLSIPFPARAAEEFLDPDAAFRVTARAVDESHVALQIDIAPGYHLYCDRLAIDAEPAGLLAPKPALPAGKQLAASRVIGY